MSEPPAERPSAGLRSLRSSRSSRDITSPGMASILRASLTRNPASAPTVTTLPPYSASLPGTPPSTANSAASIPASATSQRTIGSPQTLRRSDLTPASAASTATAGPQPQTLRRSDLAPNAGSERASTIMLTSTSSVSLASTATSKTRERLRKIEQENEELRLAMEKEKSKSSKLRQAANEERAVADRLKREGSASEMSAVEEKLRMLRLEKEAGFGGARSSSSSSPSSRPRPTTGMFKEACSTDLLFLIDTTASMMPSINAAKDQVRSIVADIKEAFLNDADVRIAVVGYKDHDDSPNVQFLDFTESADTVRRFLDGLQAYGGGDAPEDVLGGLRQALNASWRQQTRCIIHIADAPPHGRTLHDMGDSHDTYPTPGSEPHGLTHEPLLAQMLALKINYALLGITPTTDRMAYVFLQSYAAASADCKLLGTNKYYGDACRLLTSVSTLKSISSGGGAGFSLHGGPQGGLLFEESKLGTTYSALRHLVVRCVTSSASRTAMRLSTSHAMRASRPGGGGFRKALGGLGAITEDDGTAMKTKTRATAASRLETTPPLWHKTGWLDETLSVEGFSPDVVVHKAGTLDAMMADSNSIKLSVVEMTIRKRSRPFAQGALRTASYARTAASTNRFVVKTFKDPSKQLAHFAEDMRCQVLCRALALEFNALVGDMYSLEFVVTTCLKGTTTTTRGGASSDIPEFLALEMFIEGTYVKYNTNAGWVNTELASDRFCQAAQAFSHFTFERSRGRFLVSDLQGAGGVLTDPSISTSDPDLFSRSDTNLGPDGIKFFFMTHVCNTVCSRLGLHSNKSMLSSSVSHLDFRTNWPGMADTVCCSNKLCGKIVRPARANASDAFPGHRWCPSCWLQLGSSTTKRVCVADGPHHEFDVSKFFYESQGRPLPRRCPDHRGTDDTAARISTAGTSLLARLRSATKA